MVHTGHDNKKFCLSKRPRPPKFKHFVCYLRLRRKKIFSFQAQIAVQRHYFMVCNVLIFLACQKVGGQKDTLAPPPQKVGGQMPPLPPGCYAYDTTA